MDANDVRLPPQDLDAERSVLGSVLLSEKALDEVMLVLRPEQFYAIPNRMLFAAIAEMRDSGNTAIDGVTLGHELERRGELAEIGGPSYIVQILQTVPHAAHAEHYAKIVRDKWLRRKINDEATASLRAVHTSEDTETLLARVEQTWHDLIENGTPQKSSSISEMLLAVFDERDKERRQGVATTYQSLDAIVDGMMPGTITILAARPSMGKTAFALNIARRVSGVGRRVLIVSLEQPKLEIAERMLSMESEIGIQSMRKGLLEEADQWALSEASNRLNPLPIRIEDRSYLTPTTIAALSRLEKRRAGMDLLIIDYLQLIENDDTRIQSREQQVATCCRQLKGLAKDLDVPILLLAQLNRQVESREDKAPRLADLRESGAIEQDADQVWFLWRPEVYQPDCEPGVAHLKVAKNRNGPLGEVQFSFRAKYFKFDVLADVAVPEDFHDRPEKYDWR